MFAVNASGWANNFHCMWIKHFELVTRKQLRSPDDYRLLGHDSHVSADFVSFCIHHRIDLILILPHSLHLLQPLDVGVFSPLKRAISTQISRFIRSRISRIQKVVWLERFIIARKQGITRENVLAEWRGVGLFPENMHRILKQLTDYEDLTLPNIHPSSHTTHSAFFPNSCRSDPSSVHAINQAFLAELSNTDINTPYKTQVRQLCNFREECQAEALMPKVELQEVKEINGRRKEREGGKRHVLKGKPVASTEAVEKALRELEEAADRKKKGKEKRKGKGKRAKKQVVSSDDDIDSSTDVSCDIDEPLESEVFDCIEVA